MIDYQELLKKTPQHDLLSNEQEQIEDVDVFLVCLIEFLIWKMISWSLVRYERIIRSDNVDLLDVFSCDNITRIALSSS